MRYELWIVNYRPNVHTEVARPSIDYVRWIGEFSMPERQPEIGFVRLQPIDRGLALLPALWPVHQAIACFNWSSQTSVLRLLALLPPIPPRLLPRVHMT